MDVELVTLSEWGDLLPETGFEVFHTVAVLDTIEAHSSADLRLYAGFEAGEPAALLPVFCDRRSVGRVLLSPPPSMGVPYIGPLIVSDRSRTRRHERINRTFTREVLDALSASSRLRLFRTVCSPAYQDTRPYEWNGLETRPRFTYRLRADGSPESVLRGFSSSLRREVSKLSELDVSVDVEGVDAARVVYDDLAERYAEQEEPFPLTWAYVRDVVSALDDRSRVYVARDGTDEFLAGLIVLYSTDTGYFWEGGSRSTYENVSVNSLLHWRVLADIAEDPALESVTEYDFVGANTERLCRYKAKFNPDLVRYSVVESSRREMRFAKRTYQLLQR